MTASPKANPTPVPGRPEPGEEFFRQSIADLSKRLGERAARQSTSEPQAAAEARRRAMKAYERERARKIRLALTGAGVVFATAGFAWAVVLLGEPDILPPPTSQIADVQSAPSNGPAPADPTVVTSAAPPAAAQPQPVAPPQASEPPPPTAVTEGQPPSPPIQADPPPVQAATAPPSEPPQAQPAVAVVPPRASPLSRGEIREVQKRLRGFGFDPGPADGVAGRQTEIATQRYLEARGQPQLPPTDRDLLEQLRQDPAPEVQVPPNQIAQRPTQSDGAYSGYSTQPSAAPQPQQQQRRYSSVDPFKPVKAAGAQITRWLEGVFHAPASGY